MKVTVCFGSTRVVVPCGDGNLYVKDLIREATLRYKKATGKNSDAAVIVHHFQSMSGGGILDPDDRLSDVVDDREQIVVNFEDVTNGVIHHGGGDGASGSSVGTCSPDIFRVTKKVFPIEDEPQTESTCNNIEVTADDIHSASSSSQLQVRRGSEPVLNIDSKQNEMMVQDDKSSDLNEQMLKRWSAAAPVHLETSSSNSLPTIHQRNLNYQVDVNYNPKDSGTVFSRDNNNRLSMQFASPSIINHFNSQWVDNNISNQILKERKEPLGQAKCSDNTNINNNTNNSIETVIISKEFGKRLGLHISPVVDNINSNLEYCTSSGLIVEAIEPGSLIDRDGRIAVHDRVLEINGHNVAHVPVQNVYELFQSSELYPDHVVLKIVKHKQKAPPPPVFPKPTSKRPAEISTEEYSALTSKKAEEKENVGMIEVEERLSKPASKLAMVSTTKKLPQSFSNNSSIRSAKSSSYALVVSNTRKIGKIIELELVKGVHGLGFSITTRDNPAGGNCPIYIKNILPKGSAVEDGRLRSGDRLLETNGIQMTGKTQNEAVAILRNAPFGSKVKIVVSRQVDDIIDQEKEKEVDTITTKESKIEDLSHLTVANCPSSNNQMENPTENPTMSLFDSRRVLTLDIPINDNEQSGLGISVKGKCFSDNEGKTYDLGIFVKNVLQGGAAFHDKRLQVNDQLLMVNGVTLLSQSNSEAMETLRRALVKNQSPNHNSVTITIARSLLSNTDDSTTTSSSDCFAASENSIDTAIFKLPQLPPHQSSSNLLPEAPPLPNRNLMENCNPVVNKLMLNEKPLSQLRNESYYIATRNTWNTSGQTVRGDNVTNSDVQLSTIGSNNSREKIIIEDEVLDSNLHYQQFHAKDPHRPLSTHVETEQQPSSAYESQSSLDTTVMPANAFSRDAFGRQSVSEKRHATLDAKTMNTYQRNKKLREERAAKNLQRAGSMESIADFQIKTSNTGVEGVKKSSSLESIHNLIQNVRMVDDDSREVGRSRTKFYDPNPDKIVETNAKKHWLLESPKGQDERPNFFKVSDVRKPSSLDSSLQKKEKKKSKILKNITSMFRSSHSPSSSTTKPSTVNIATSTKTDINLNPVKTTGSTYDVVHQQQLQRTLPRDSNNNRNNSASDKRANICTYSQNVPYGNYNEIQNQFMARKEQLTENQIAQMRVQVQKQRVKVEEENRRHYYQSQRQPRSQPHMRPVSNFYEYESIAGTMAPSNMMLQHNPTMQRRPIDNSTYAPVSVSETRRLFENPRLQPLSSQQSQLLNVPGQGRYAPLQQTSPGANINLGNNSDNNRRPYVTHVQIGGGGGGGGGGGSGSSSTGGDNLHQFSSKV